MSTEEVRSFSALSSERIRLLCKIVDIIIELYNSIIESINRVYYNEEVARTLRGVGTIRCCDRLYMIIARSYIEEYIRRHGMGFNRNTLRDVLKGLIDNKIIGISLIEGTDDLLNFFAEKIVEKKSRGVSRGREKSEIEIIKYELRKQMERIPHNTWFIVVDIEELGKSLGSFCVAVSLVEYMKEAQRYEKSSLLVEMLQNRGIGGITLEDILITCIILELISGSVQ